MVAVLSRTETGVGACPSAMARSLAKLLLGDRTEQATAKKKRRNKRKRDRDADVEPVDPVLVADKAKAYRMLVDQLAVPQQDEPKRRKVSQDTKDLQRHKPTTGLTKLAGPANGKGDETAQSSREADSAEAQHGPKQSAVRDTPAGANSGVHLEQQQQQQGQQEQQHQAIEGEEEHEGTERQAGDHWTQHFNRTLSAADVAELQASVPEYHDLDAGAFSGVWADSKWQGWRCEAVPEAAGSLEEAGVKERLRVRWREVHQEDQEASVASTSGRGDLPPPGGFQTPRQQSFFSAINTYRDVVVPCHPYPSSLKEPDPLVDAYLLHSLNHVAKTADRIKRNNDRIKAREEAAAAAAEDPELAAPEEEAPPRDQGFTRPKVLLLLPQRNIAYHRVVRLVRLALRETRADSVQNKAKFVDQYLVTDEEEDVTPEAAARRARRPAEYRALFEGSSDDHFLLGIKFSRGNIKLLADFYDSDIVVASPLGLVKKLAADGGVEAGAADFLSSIEVLVAERVDVLGMQNWAHLQAVMEALNLLPKQQRGVDIMRVRELYLSGHAPHFRQTVLLSSLLTADVNALLHAHCRNHAGRLRLRPQPRGVLSMVVHQVQQMFERFPVAAPADVAAARFAHFTAAVWPRLRDASTAGLLLFVPHYYDFVRLRNFLRAEDASFAALSEYVEGPAMARARGHFAHGRRRVLLYTERAHFYHRPHLKGVKDVFFYALPQHSHFYTEVVNMMEEVGGVAATHGTVGALFCRFDALELERIVGASRGHRMLRAENPTFIFC